MSLLRTSKLSALGRESILQSANPKFGLEYAKFGASESLNNSEQLVEKQSNIEIDGQTDFLPPEIFAELSEINKTGLIYVLKSGNVESIKKYIGEAKNSKIGLLKENPNIAKVFLDELKKAIQTVNINLIEAIFVGFGINFFDVSNSGLMSFKELDYYLSAHSDKHIKKIKEVLGLLKNIK